MFVNDDHLSDMTENEKRKEGNDLMTCFVIHVSLLPLHIPFGATLLNAELLQICKQHKPTPSFLLDKILNENGYDCLRLPAYHADLNSIELIWATMKGYIARRNVSFKMTDVIQLTHDAIAAVTEDDWASS